MENEQETQLPIQLTPEVALNGESPLVITATFKPVADLDRFQPAGFPEVGHVIYKAPRADGSVKYVCIVDSAASMANHLESICMRGPHDMDLVEDLAAMPYLRCITEPADADPPEQDAACEVVVTSLTEGHRIASTYFLDGKRRSGQDAPVAFKDELATEMGIALKGDKKAHPPAAKWWNVYKTIYKYDPNALVHGVLFPQWQIKIPRMLTAHMEAFGASRVDRSGVKFDRLGKTTSGQPIFAVDDATAQEIRATFILDVALLKSFGRNQNGQPSLGLTDNQKRFLVALALWKISRLVATPFRFRSGCHLKCQSLRSGDHDATIVPDLQIETAEFRAPGNNQTITDIYWPRQELYQEGEPATPTAANEGAAGEDGAETPVEETE
jgi:CRISPR-associated protein Csb1